MRVSYLVILMACLAGSLAVVAHAADGPVQMWGLIDQQLQRDYPHMCLDADGNVWVVFIEHDGQADQLKLARKTDNGLEIAGALSERGSIHQPRIACDGQGALWAVWSQLVDGQGWNLRARRIVNGRIDEQTQTLAGGAANHIYPDARTDRHGRVWIAWQSLRGADGIICARYLDPASGNWSKEIAVTSAPGGDWEPRLAFGDKDEAAIVYDSARGGSFDVMLAIVQLDGTASITAIANSPAYEARATIAASADGKGYWVAWERGQYRWGGVIRGHFSRNGLNAEKQIDVVYVDAASKTIKPLPNVKPLIRSMAAAAAGVNRLKNDQAIAPEFAVNLPQLFVDAQGTPWMMARYARNDGIWHIALTRYDQAAGRWAQPITLDNSNFGQDRQCHGLADRNGNIWMIWPSDLRQSKQAQVAHVYLGKMSAAAPMALSDAPAELTASAQRVRVDPAKDTPRRTRTDRYTMRDGDKSYGLYWGDFHRHTSFSNCRTTVDGSIDEQFRYAYEAGVLDFLGTTDHTDIGRVYQPYEWWEDQKLADLFHVPGFFTSFYAYEREQRWPWGHRNIIFEQRGGPMIYIHRKNYQASPWAKDYPVAGAEAEITPQELWKTLRDSGRRVTAISHTGATGMGTDWSLYKEIDDKIEHVVEIYQGARVSYEGLRLPQPKAGIEAERDKGADSGNAPNPNPPNFGLHRKGVYQNALSLGHKLGVFASSDHISTGAAFGGVYAESFTRAGILDGIDARRTIAGTDKIFLEFRCNGQLLGSIFQTRQKPAIEVKVQGTAPIAKVTIVRNEADYKVFAPADKSKDFAETFTDPEPIVGENRYYIRVEQTDGNMAWASPVWVTYGK